MNIAVFSVTPEAEKSFHEGFPDENLSFFADKISDENIIQCAEADVISLTVESDLTKERAALLPKLKLVAARSTGYDNVDLSALKERGIALVSVPGYGSKPVAEFTFALMLALVRRVTEAHDEIRKGMATNPSHFQGMNLFGKTLGVLGTGKIGQGVIHIAKGFRMNVIAFDIFPNQDFAKIEDFVYVSLDEILAQSDIITVHVPYNKETHHLLNKESFAKMKKGVYIINTARGAIIDTNALLEGLKSEIVAGAGLDVLEGEHELTNEFGLLAKNVSTDQLKLIIEDHVLIGMPNVIVTPHIAFNSREAVQEIIDTTIANIKAFSSETPQNVVRQ